MASSAAGAAITVKGSDLTGLATVNVAAANVAMTITDTKITCNDAIDTEYYGAITVGYGATNATVNVIGGEIIANDDSKAAIVFEPTATVTGVEANVIVAMIGLAGYETLADAVAAAKAGETVDLVRDVALTEILTIDKAITLDGNGNTINSTAARAINVEVAGDVIIKNVTINAAERAINIINKPANVTVDNVTATAKNNAIMLATSAAGANLTVNGCDFTGLAVINVASADSVVVINNTTIDCVDANAEENYGAITVYNTATNANVTVNGGEITVADDSKAAYVFAPNATVTLNNVAGDNNVGAVVAMIGDAGFDTLAEAIADAKAGQTIDLVRDVTLTETLTVAKDVTLDLNGNTISGDFAGTFGIIYVKNGATLTINGDGAIRATAGDAIGNYGTVIVNGGDITTDAGTYYGAIYNYCYAADYYGTTVINGGNVGSVLNCGIITVNGGNVAYLDNSGKLAVEGGAIETIIARDGTDSKVEDAGIIEIENTEAIVLLEGYDLVEVESGVYKVVDHKLNHTAAVAVKENEVAATCTKEGSYDSVVYCSVCNEELSRETIPTEKLEHTPAVAVKENEVAATCTKEGSYDSVVYCSVCGEELDRETTTTEKLEHTPAVAVKENEVAATCTKEGSYDSVVYCSVCNEELSRETIPTEKIAHNYVDGKCEVCGEKDPDAVVGEITTIGKTLSLTGEIFINLYSGFTGFDGIDIATKGGLLEWRGVDVTDETATIDTATKVTEGLLYDSRNKRYAQQSSGISSKCYSDTIYMRMYVEVGEGEYVYGELIEYSVRTYCENQINKHYNNSGSTAKQRALADACIALLHYGTAAQYYFDNYRIDDLANKNIVDKYPTPEWNDNYLTDLAAVNTNIVTDGTTVTEVGKTLSLSGAIFINFYSKTTIANSEVESAELLYWAGVSGQLTEDNVTSVVDMTYDARNKRYGGQSDMISAKDYGTTVYACTRITTADGVYYGPVIAYSPEAYAKGRLEKSDDELLKNTVKNMTIYGELASIYFSK